MSKVSLNKNRY